MHRLMYLSFIALFTLALVGYAANNAPSPTGISDQMSYSTTDDLGDIIGTIPSANPGPSNAWVGMAWANGYLYTLKNVASPTGTTLYQIDPANGNILNQYNLPFAGYSMGITYDGSNFWVAQWYPSNKIWHVSMTGVEVPGSFIPSTGIYSCRSVNWDGANLWVGANAGSNNTNLYKMSTAGAILETYSTGTAVGWYMGGEIDTQAPTESQLFVVDNVGNTVKRLQIVGGVVSVMASFASPATIAEGLTFDGEYLWHCDAYATQGVIWQIDDGIAGGPPPDVSITMTPINPPIQIPSGGGSFDFNVTLTNNEVGPANFDAWIKATLPTGPEVLVLGPINLTRPGSSSLTRLRTQNVPAGAPSGTYTYTGYVGYYPMQVADSDFFTFEKMVDDQAGGFMGEWANYGESFDAGLEAATPAQFALLGNYPNPFNPSTTIRYALTNGDFVNLTVFDLTGREVATLVNGYRDAGSHEITFDASALTSGVYVYRLTSGSQTATAKMVLMK